MPASIKPNRSEVSRAFPIAGFSIRTGVTPSWVEVAVATTPELLYGGPQVRSQRNPNNFWSSRVMGLLPAERGEAVFLLPPQVLGRFVGQERLYYGMAMYRQNDTRNPEVTRLPLEAVPYMRISATFTGSTRGLMGIGSSSGGLTNAGNQYVNGDPASLEWGADTPTPGEVVAVAAPTNGSQPANGSNGRANGNGTAPANGNPAQQPAAQSLAYDDGFGMDFWSRSQSAPQYDTNYGMEAVAQGTLGRQKGRQARAYEAEVTADYESYGIDAPIPDEEAAYSAGLAYSRAMSAPEYPQASRFVAARHFRAMPNGRTINRIVIHITDGGRNINGTIGWFQNPTRNGNPVTVSAHYVIGQDGEIVQMVNHSDVAYHASSANGDSIGIEHCANTRGLNPTEAQYCASAALVNWLCQQYGIPMDRVHILGHSEADPHTTHSGCPNAVWDWDYYMGLVTSGTCEPVPTAQAYNAMQMNGNGHNGKGYKRQQNPAPRRASATPFSNDIFYNVPLIPQPNKTSCWAGSMAMLVSFRQNASVTPESLAEQVGRNLRTSYGWDMLEAVKDQFGFQDISLPSNASLYPSPSQWYEWLNNYGPLWVTTIGAPSHAIIVQGISGDLTPAGTTMHILNPWDINTPFDNDPVDFHPFNNGLQYQRTFEDFAAEFGNLGLDNYGEWRVLYLPPMTAQSQSLGYGSQRHTTGMAHNGNGNGRSAKGYSNGQSRPMSMTRPRAFSGQSFDVNWTDIQLIPQLTDWSCWAASAAMIIGWRDRMSFPPEEIANNTGRWAEYAGGLNPSDRREVAAHLGLVMEPPQDYTIDGLRSLLENNGPLWVGILTAGGTGHIIVVKGMYGDGTVANTFVRILDPAPVGTGSEYDLKIAEFIHQYDERISVNPADGTVNVQVLHANGRRPISTQQSYSRAQAFAQPSQTRKPIRRPAGHSAAQSYYASGLAFSPMDGGAVDQMRLTFMNNAASGAARQNCITITNAGLRQLYGSRLQDSSGNRLRLGSTIQDTMAALQGYGLAGTEQLFQFNDSSGQMTRGVTRPDHLQASIESWLLNEADANQMSAWYVFGLSIMDGYHSVVLAVQFSGIGDPNTHIYWCDQIYSGWDDVTGSLDARITQLTQRWWDPLPANRKARTRVTLWPLNF